jgi:hypothetical protein
MMSFVNQIIHSDCRNNDYHWMFWKTRYSCDACLWADCMMDELEYENPNERTLIFKNNVVVYNENNIYHEARMETAYSDYRAYHKVAR